MKNENIVVEPIRFNYENTEIMFLDKTGDYTIEDFISLLEEAKERWGNKRICVHDSSNGFSKSVNELILDDDSICIYT